MKKYILPLGLLPLFAFAEPKQQINSATIQPIENYADYITESKLKKNISLTHQLLVKALLAKDIALIENLLSIYQTFPDVDSILILFTKAKIAFLQQNYPKSIAYYREILAQNPQLDPVRIELAIALFYDKQNIAAEEQFLKAKREDNLPKLVLGKIDAYLEAIKKQDEWNIDASISYIRDTNVNSVSENQNIENTGYIKNNDMLPKTAHGYAFNVSINKDFNLFQRHYLAAENDAYGKIYWDNHEYDDITNRILLGYKYKTASSTFALLPFYEKRWYGNESYNWSNGIRAELIHWLTPHWQASFAAEQFKSRFFNIFALNGNTRLISATFVWARTPQQFFYIGADFNQEKTQVKQYSSDTKALRLGWGQEWNKGISSRLSFSINTRDYKDLAILGGMIPLGKIRKDKNYNLNLTLWKRDWHLFGITPKIQLNYFKRRSNLATLFSYTDKNIRIIFEKTF